jgi:hypothetical protein
MVVDKGGSRDHDSVALASTSMATSSMTGQITGA